MDRNPSYQDIQDMKYLDLVVKESQRMYPSVPLISRESTENMTLNGTFIPKGTQLTISIMATGYNEKFFPDPYKFNPERFTADNISNRSSAYEYIPFSAGPRNCIGQKFAVLEMKSVISKMVRNFEILPPSDDLISKDGYQRWEQNEHDPKLSSVLTLKSDNGVNVKLRLRKY